MSERPHSELQDLLGVWALDAIDADERRELEAHLLSCARCRAEATELQEVAGGLSGGAAPAPAGVWARIAAELDSAETPPPMRLVAAPLAGSAAQPATGPAPGPITEDPAQPLAQVVDLRAGRASRGGVLGVAAAVALIAGVLGLGIGRGLTDNNPPTQSAASLDQLAHHALDDSDARLAQLRTPGGSVLAVAVVRANGQGFLIGNNLPALNGRLYQLWGATGDGTVISLGVLDHPGVASFSADGHVKTLMLTAETVPVARSSQQAVVIGDLA